MAEPWYIWDEINHALSHNHPGVNPCRNIPPVEMQAMSNAQLILDQARVMAKTAVDAINQGADVRALQQAIINLSNKLLRGEEQYSYDFFSHVKSISEREGRGCIVGTNVTFARILSKFREGKDILNVAAEVNINLKTLTQVLDEASKFFSGFPQDRPAASIQDGRLFCLCGCALAHEVRSDVDLCFILPSELPPPPSLTDLLEGSKSCIPLKAIKAEPLLSDLKYRPLYLRCDECGKFLTLPPHLAFDPAGADFGPPKRAPRER